MSWLQWGKNIKIQTKSREKKKIKGGKCNFLKESYHMVTKGTYIQEMSVKSTHHTSAPYLENYIQFLMTLFFKVISD